MFGKSLRYESVPAAPPSNESTWFHDRPSLTDRNTLDQPCRKSFCIATRKTPGLWRISPVSPRASPTRSGAPRMPDVKNSDHVRPWSRLSLIVGRRGAPPPILPVHRMLLNTRWASVASGWIQPAAAKSALPFGVSSPHGFPIHSHVLPPSPARHTLTPTAVA